MTPPLLENNLALLETRDSVLSKAIAGVVYSGKYEVAASRSGSMTLSRVFPDQSRKSLHSAYNPQQEAARFMDTCRIDDSSNFLVTGMGLGYHVQELVRRAKPSSRILIIEKDPEIFRLAVEHNDLAEVINHPGVSFHIGTPLDEIAGIMENDRTGFVINGHCPINLKSLVDGELPYYFALTQSIEKVLRETHVNLNTQAAFSKTFYKNIIENWSHIRGSRGVNTVRNALAGYPAIIISAGPSLDKNIGLLKAAADRATLISVGTALKPLLQNGVCPDFVIAIDSDDINLKAFDLDTLPPDLCLVFDPCVPAAIPQKFAGNRLVMDSDVEISRWIANNIGEKGSLGKIFSVAHTALLFAKHLGCDPAILVGQDLSFAGSRLHCTGTYYNQIHQDQLGNERTLELLDKQKHEGFGQSLTPAKDLFDQPATTTLALDVYKERFAQEIDGSFRVYNATEGGVPIPGVSNLSLREAMATCCRENISSVKQKLLAQIAPSETHGDPVPALNKQAGRFRHFLDRVEEIKSRNFDYPGGACSNRAGFVRDMEDFYRELLNDETTAKLMQGYHYSGFIHWNQENSALSRLSAHCGQEEIENEKFERDRKFLDIASETALFLYESFHSLGR